MPHQQKPKEGGDVVMVVALSELRSIVKFITKAHGQKPGEPVAVLRAHSALQAGNLRLVHASDATMSCGGCSQPVIQGLNGPEINIKKD